MNDVIIFALCKILSVSFYFD